MRSRLAGVFQAGSVTRMGWSSDLQRRTSLSAWRIRYGIGLKSVTFCGEEPQSVCVRARGRESDDMARTQPLAHGIPDLHVLPPDGGSMLSDVQFALLFWRRWLCLCPCFCHGDVSIASDGHEAVRRWYDRFWCVVSRVPGAERGRANVHYEGRNFVWGTPKMSTSSRESINTLSSIPPPYCTIRVLRGR